MQNTLTDLNNHLFAQLERLSDEELKEETLQEEIGRAKAVSDIASTIIANGGLVLKAKTFLHEYAAGEKSENKLPPMLKAAILGD